MSKTFGHTKSIRQHKYRSPKGKPYVADKDLGKGKHGATSCNVASPHGDGYPGYKLGISKTAKLVRRNANRALKKAARQQGLKQILEEL
jgi:hypothetical protein